MGISKLANLRMSNPIVIGFGKDLRNHIGDWKVDFVSRKIGQNLSIGLNLSNAEISLRIKILLKTNVQ